MLLWKNKMFSLKTLLILSLFVTFAISHNKVEEDPLIEEESLSSNSEINPEVKISNKQTTEENDEILDDVTIQDMPRESEEMKEKDIVTTEYRETVFEKDDFSIDESDVAFPNNELIELDGGSFMMGTDDPPILEDGESPARTVILNPYAIDKFEISNGEFIEFVKATNHVTEAEMFGNSFVMEYFMSKEENEKITEAVAGAQWWLPVAGANWKHPEGRDSNIEKRMHHPVVHVSWNDARAFCLWKGKRLPTEAEWEYACRGGKQNRLYPWGNKFMPHGEYRANIWQGEFPTNNTAEDGYAGTCPVEVFLQNSYGVYNMVGNVWEWVMDWWDTVHDRKPQNNPSGPSSGQDKTKKGGSFMCTKSFCYRYRCSARDKNSADSSALNLGFRCAKSLPKKTKKEKTEL